jgi:hypothetical protein
MKRLLFCFLFMCGAAQAQAPQQQSPELRALNMRLSAEINGKPVFSLEKGVSFPEWCSK